MKKAPTGGADFIFIWLTILKELSVKYTRFCI
jgi:hypothetical protein